MRSNFVDIAFEIAKPKVIYADQVDYRTHHRKLFRTLRLKYKEYQLEISPKTYIPYSPNAKLKFFIFFPYLLINFRQLSHLSHNMLAFVSIVINLQRLSCNSNDWHAVLPTWCVTLELNKYETYIMIFLSEIVFIHFSLVQRKCLI